jgi:hypothetical protein
MTATRKPLSKKTRFEVFKRDGFKCMYCGAHPPEAILEVDHVKPVADGGKNHMDNLITSCFACNRGKAANSLDSIPQSLSDKATAIKEAEAQIKGYHAVMEAKRKRLDVEAWALMNLWRVEKDSAPRDWMNSMRMFIEKLGYHEVMDAIEIAMGKGFYSEQKTWRYFCGICWNKLRKQEGAL